MGGQQTKEQGDKSERNIKILIEKTRLFQEKVDEIMCLRETENQAYEQEMIIQALKEAEWKRERKWLRGEVKSLRKKLEEGERRNRGVKNEMVGEKSEKVLHNKWDTDYILEHMREERAHRNEAVEKWKRLYLAIKIELDNLIKRTHQGAAASWREEEEYLADELRRELKAKEETIELLQAHITSMEQEESRREREVDILRQSLRIMSQNKKPKHSAKGLSRNMY